MEKKIEILPFFMSPASLVTQSLLNSVIEKSYRIALKYLQFHRLKITKLISNQNLTLQELAIDCIAGMFVKENNSELISLKLTFNNWEPEIVSEDDCIYFLNRVVASRVEQHIFKLLKEADPFFSKLLDSTNYLIRTCGYSKVCFLGKTFITETAEAEFEKCFISNEEFEKLPIALFQNKKTLLAVLFDHINNETDYNPAIPLNDLINRLKHINFSEYLVNEFVNNEFKKIEVKEIVDDGFNFVMDKLLNSYLEKGKLDSKEKNAFELALKEMSIDLSDGGINPGLYQYLSPHLAGLSETEYKSKYHNTLEYLLKVMKSKIAEQIKNTN